MYGVELLVRGDEVYFADVGPRPYDSGLVTLRSQRLSEFELHARAILGLPVDTIMVTPGAAEVVYAGQETGSANAELEDDDVAPNVRRKRFRMRSRCAESDVRIFGHPKS